MSFLDIEKRYFRVNKRKFHIAKKSAFFQNNIMDEQYNKKLYELSWHIRKTDNVRIRNKFRKIINIIPIRYGSDIKIRYTKRKVWFLKGDLKFMRVWLEKTCLRLKIKTPNGWTEIGLREWEDFSRIYNLLDL